MLLRIVCASRYFWILVMWLKIEHIDKAPWKIIISTYRFIWWDKSFSSQDVCPWIVETRVGYFHYYDDVIAYQLKTWQRWQWTLAPGIEIWAWIRLPVTTRREVCCHQFIYILYDVTNILYDFWQNVHIHRVFDIWINSKMIFYSGCLAVLLPFLLSNSILSRNI